MSMHTAEEPGHILDALPGHALILNCFGRGGSNIVWSMIGSSPDVIFPNQEWHQAVFGRHHILRKTMRSIGRQLDWNLVPSFSRFISKRTLRAIPVEEILDKKTPKAITLKVMGHHIVFANAIEAGFRTHQHLILTRHPLPMCEGMIRGGSSETHAIRMYNEIVDNMKTVVRRPSTLIIKFEDLISDPSAFCQKLFRDLKIQEPHSGQVRFKVKKFGSERDRNNMIAEGVYTPFAYADLHKQIDSEVNRKSVARLTPELRERIWMETRSVARLFGYESDNY